MTFNLRQIQWKELQNRKKKVGKQVNNNKYLVVEESLFTSTW